MTDSESAFTSQLTAEITATVQHPDREMTEEERRHLGLPDSVQEGE